mgnify:CR=1 FL=1
MNILDEILEEAAIKRKKVVRGGKVIKKKTCPPGYKVSGNRCQKMSSQERITRKKAGKKSSRKSKSARRRSFQKSVKLRQRRNLNRNR